MSNFGNTSLDNLCEVADFFTTYQGRLKQATKHYNFLFDFFISAYLPINKKNGVYLNVKITKSSSVTKKL